MSSKLSNSVNINTDVRITDRYPLECDLLTHFRPSDILLYVRTIELCEELDICEPGDFIISTKSLTQLGGTPLAQLGLYSLIYVNRKDKPADLTKFWAQFNAVKANPDI
jgi:hypothetical protein